MKITQVRLGRISTPLRVPFKTALRTVNSVEDVIVELHTDTGAVGYGEAPPTGVITGDTAGAIIGAIQDHIAPAILGHDIDEFEDLTAAVQKALVHNTSAKAAVDMALWDLLGQKYNAPVYRMLGGARKNIVTDITISVNPPEEMALDARTAIARGYDCLKVKVGIDPELDVARLAAVREAVGREVCIRIDANQAWNAKQAVRILNQMQDKGLDIEFVEQPVPAADLEGMQYVTRHADEQAHQNAQDEAGGIVLCHESLQRFHIQTLLFPFAVRPSRTDFPIPLHGTCVIIVSGSQKVNDFAHFFRLFIYPSPNTKFFIVLI